MPTHRPNAALVACGLAAALALAGAAAPGTADDSAAKAFNDLYGARVAQAAATKEADDDLALAADLLAAAKAPNVAPALLALLCEKAFALASPETRGAPTAIEAMTLLAARVPEKRAACQDRIIDVYQGEYAKARGVEKVKAGEALVRQITRFGDARVEDADYPAAVALYRRAMPLAATLRDVNRDEVKTKLDYAVTRAGFRSQVEKLEALLKADPNDQEARSELVRIYVVELDNPAQAAKRLDLSRDSLSAKFVLLAGMSPESLPRRALPELGRWYQGLAEKSSAQGRLIALARAKTYFERYLASGDEADQRLEVATALDQVDAVLAKAAAASAKLTVVTFARFQADAGLRFPPEANLAAQGDARASSHWGNRLPEDVFGGRRTGDAWSLNGPKGWFLARWNSPVRGRYILLFARAGTGSGDAWGEAAITINDTRPQRVEGMESGRVLIVDLGMTVPVASVRLDIKGTTYPGLAAVEIHPDGPRAKPAGAPAADHASEAEPAPF